MWRSAGKVSYLQYANEMANVLRECLKEPLKEKAQRAARLQLKERVFQNGTEVSRVEISDLREAFSRARTGTK